MKVIQKLERMLNDAEKSRTWGHIQIDLQDGKPVVLRETVTRKLEREDNRGHATFCDQH